MKNESVEFQCSTDSVTKSLRWHVIYAGSKESFAIIARRNSSSASAGELRYSIDTSGRGQCTLTMKAVTMSYAGKYMCSEGFAGPEVEAELAVVGKIVSFDIFFTSASLLEQTNFILR